jgi:DNA-binding transcriptional MerR regulator
MSAKEFIGISEAARRLGVSAQTLRVRSDKGLLACERDAYGYRVFRVEVIAAEKRRRDAKANA